MSRNPYVQVALTYIRRPFASVQVGIVIAVVAGFLGLHLLSIFRIHRLHANPVDEFKLLTPFLMAVAFLAGFLAMHIKDQFADARSHLMPDYRRVHLVVAALATVILVIVAPSS